MRKTVIFGAGALCLLTLLSSCSGTKKKVQEFAGNFASMVERGETDSLRAVYPAIEKADSLSLSCSAGDIKVEGTDTDGVYKVIFNENASALIKVDKEGNMTVTETTGVFAYPERKLRFARMAGGLKEGMNDEKTADAMSNVDGMITMLYDEYASKRKNAIRNAGETITDDVMNPMDSGRGYYTLENTTDEDIMGDEYTVTWNDESFSGFGMGTVGSKYRIEKGKSIPAHGVAQFPFEYSGRFATSIVKITMTTLSSDEFMAKYKPKGNEYARYIDTYGDNSGKKSKFDGPYNISGKLGGKYPIHMVINKGMKDGYYYYDKYGSGNRLQLNVKDYNKKTGEIKLEELNDKGEITGTFTGTLTTSGFSGFMSSFTGKGYDFDLKVYD